MMSTTARLQIDYEMPIRPNFESLMQTKTLSGPLRSPFAKIEITPPVSRRR